MVLSTARRVLVGARVETHPLGQTVVESLPLPDGDLAFDAFDQFGAHGEGFGPVRLAEHESIEHVAFVAANPSGVNAPVRLSARISPHVTQLQQFAMVAGCFE